MSPGMVLDAGLVAAAFAGFFLAYVIVRVRTRPAAVRPAAATPDLGGEPPAVACLVAGGWVEPEEAAPATLLDLTARGHLELRQPDKDPRHTTVHVLDRPAGELSPFERRVLDRVRGLARHGVVPVTALTFRDSREAARWNDGLHAEVVAEARRLGLSRPRFSRATVTGLSLAALGVGAAVFSAVLHFCLTQMRPPSLAAGLIVGTLAALFVIGPLSRLSTADLGERDTAHGQRIAAQWLGVRQWLRAHDTFADLPPAAVGLWDRYLSYGTALGVNRVASALLDLGMGDRRRVWSGMGGTWHRVRVRYPRWWPHYGRRAGELAAPAVKAVVGGVVLLLFHWVPREYLPGLVGQDVIGPEWFDLFEMLAVLAGVVMVPLGAVRLLQVLFDVATPRTITGEVLWVEAWPDTRIGRPCPGRRYLAIDDGTGPRTTAWALPSGPTCRAGDAVTIKVRRWTRRVVDLRDVQRGPAQATAAVTGEGLRR